MIRKIAIIWGLGGGFFDPSSGEVAMVARCKAIGLDIGASPYHYDDGQSIYEFLKTADWRGIVGDSFGACFGPDYAGDLAPTKVDFLGGFQPSVYSSNIKTLADGNVITAHVIRDPDWIDTAGLGYAKWIADNPKTTRLLETDHRGAHPDDWGYSQDLMFAEIKQLMGA